MAEPQSMHGRLRYDAHGIHTPFQWTYADEAARTAAEGFIAADVGKVAWQLDDGSGNATFWVLSDEDPVTWIEFGGGGGGGGVDQLSELTDVTLGGITLNPGQSLVRSSADSAEGNNWINWPSLLEGDDSRIGVAGTQDVVAATEIDYSWSYKIYDNDPLGMANDYPGSEQFDRINLPFKGMYLTTAYIEVEAQTTAGTFLGASIGVYDAGDTLLNNVAGSKFDATLTGQVYQINLSQMFISDADSNYLKLKLNNGNGTDELEFSVTWYVQILRTIPGTIIGQSGGGG